MITVCKICKYLKINNIYVINTDNFDIESESFTVSFRLLIGMNKITHCVLINIDDNNVTYRQYIGELPENQLIDVLKEIYENLDYFKNYYLFSYTYSITYEDYKDKYGDEIIRTMKKVKYIYPAEIIKNAPDYLKTLSLQLNNYEG